MKLQCPYCDFVGDFQKAEVPFFVFSLLDLRREKSRAKRTHICPECGTELVFPREIDHEHFQDIPPLRHAKCAEGDC